MVDLLRLMLLHLLLLGVGGDEDGVLLGQHGWVQVSVLRHHAALRRHGDEVRCPGDVGEEGRGGGRGDCSVGVVGGVDGRSRSHVEGLEHDSRGVRERRRGFVRRGGDRHLRRVDGRGGVEFGRR